ncbi:MAG: FesM [Planctomycetaceae bacterium]|nr:FesM [Planctomycetaceae bacterium]
MRLPWLGRFLRWRGSRRTLQLPVFVLSLVMIAHAFWGPDLAPKNLAALLTWVHFRGLVVLVILLAGNLFCMACPFMLPRELARRWIAPRWEWPRALRNKWLAIALFVLVLFAYEWLDLWSNPLWTGMLIVTYFAAALIVDSLFRRASFCKYFCPVGQFNFLSSTLSPLEVAVRDKAVCDDCQTKDCIRGVRRSENPSSEHYQLPIVQRGCELALFQPRKVGNLDCTFCLDCVYACPHDNVGILARLPAEQLATIGTRSGIGKVERRFDFTVLATIFTFGALLNAFAMISPVYALEQSIADFTGLRVEWPILTGMFTVALVLEPAILLGAAAVATRWCTGSQESILSIVNHFARSLVPMGFGIWLAHYGFHFLTGFLTVVPVAQNAALQSFGLPLLGEPLWQLGGLPESIVFPMEVGFLSLGLLGSWLVAWSIARNVMPRRTVNGFVPWALLYLLLLTAALWIMTQPMDMRGTFLGG